MPTAGALRDLFVRPPDRVRDSARVPSGAVRHDAGHELPATVRRRHIEADSHPDLYLIVGERLPLDRSGGFDPRFELGEEPGLLVGRAGESGAQAVDLS